MNERYRLRDDDGVWWVHLGRLSYEPQRVVARDGPSAAATTSEGVKGNLSGWWGFLVQPASIEIHYPPRKVTTGWRLRPEYAALAPPMAERYESWTELEKGAGERHIDFYEGEYRDEQPEPEYVTEFGPCLDGSPPEPLPFGLEWQPKLPWALTNRPEYGHLFPGSLSGGAAYLAAELQAAFPQANVYHRHPDANVKVYRQVPFEPPKPRRTKRDRDRAMVTRSAEFRLWSIEAPSRAAALAQLDLQIREAKAEVEEMGLAACGHCGGLGYIETPERAR